MIQLPETTVFGGTGFLGREIVRALAEAGASVRIAARHPAIPDGLSADMVALHTADIRDRDAVAAAVRGAGAVVNAVGLYAESHRGPTFDDIHVEGAQRVAQCAAETGVERLIHISGVGARPDSPSKYVRARARGEQRVREAFADATISRPTVLFGPHDAFLSALDGITRLPAVPLFGRGATRLQPVHVGDLARAIPRMLQRPKTAGGTFELGGAGIHRYRDIVRMVLAHRQRRRPLVPVAFPAWLALARIMATVLPEPPLTTDQIMLMQSDNIADPAASPWDELDMAPRDIRATLGACLDA